MRVALWSAVGLLGGWTAVRLFGLDGWFPMAQLVAFTPYVAVLAPVLVGLALVARQWWAAGALGLATVVLAGCVLPRWLPDRDAAGATGPALRVLAANLLAGGADAKAVVGLVRDRRVDLLAVQELTPSAVEALDQAGLANLLPYRVLYPEPGVTGSGLYARQPLRDDGRRDNPCGFGQARGSLSGILVESVHPCSPSSRDATPPWRRALADLPAATVDGPVRLLVGDFNATLDHAALRALLATGYRDAASVVGVGLAGTWGPYDGDAIPPVTLDHVLVDRRVGVREVSVHRIRGSDHRAVLAELTLP